jgi:hypothetical protein
MIPIKIVLVKSVKENAVKRIPTPYNPGKKTKAYRKDYKNKSICIQKGDHSIL